MRTLGKIFIGFAAVMAILTSCSKDEPIYEPTTGSVEEENGQYVSVFTLSSPSAFEVKETEKVTFHITSSQLEEDLSFDGTVSPEKGAVVNGNKIRLLCRLLLSNISIPDGDYYISITGEKTPDLGTYKVSIKDRAVTQLLQSSPSYQGLSGGGTKDNPYQLKSSEDMERLMECLRDDPDHGMGLYFAMTDDINLGDKASAIIATSPFQGTLDGNNHKITGIEWKEPAKGYSSSDVGLFTSLCNATVRNLVLEDVKFSGIYERGGMLAGSATGRTTVSNVNYDGIISGEGQCIGGLIGDVQGAVNISDVVFNKGCVRGRRTHTGGLFGSMRIGSNSSVSNVLINELTVINGDDNTAGLFGYARISKTLDLKDLNVEPNSVVGKESVGVYFGYFSMVDANSLIRFGGTCNYSFANSVIGDKSVGNIAGHVRGANGKTFEFASETRARSNITSKGENAGGVCGYVSDVADLAVGKLVLPSSLMTVTAGRENAGAIFGYAYHVSIAGEHTVDPENLRGRLNYGEISSAEIQATVKAVSNSGGIIGYAEGDSRIEGFFAGGHIETINTATGGILGRGHDTTVKNCEFQGTMKCPDLFGGIIGLIDGKMDVSYCNSRLQVESPTKWQGGVIGYINLSDAKDAKVNITDSYFCGIIHYGHTGGGIVAGIRAPNSCEIKIERCGNFGEVYVGEAGSQYSSYQGAGGIVGMVDTSCTVLIRGCFNYGVVYATVKMDAIGGIVGIAGKNDSDINYTTIENCINFCNFLSCEDSNTYLGGVVGHLVQGGVLSYNQSTIRGCVNWGTITPDTKHDTGGILGYAAHQTLTERCYNRGKVSHGNAIIGTHKTGTVVYHQYNYYLEGTGGSWPDSVSIPSDKETDKSLYKKFSFKDVSSSTGFVMTNYGPLPAGLPMGAKCGSSNPWPKDLTIL